MAGTQSFSDVIKRIKAADKLIITPRMDQWLLDHPEGVVTRTQADKDLLLKLTSDESNSQRTARFGASARGTCLRQQVFRFLGMPGLRNMDSVLQNIFNDGTWRHIRWQLMGIQGGWLTDVEVKHSLPQYNLGTSLDGENSGEGWLWEHKGMRNYGKVVMGEIPPGHMLQMHTMMWVTGYERVIYTVESKPSNDWKEVIIKRDPAIIRLVKDELNRATDAIEDEKLPPVQNSCRNKKGDEYKQCPFRNKCIAQKDFPTTQEWG